MILGYTEGLQVMMNLIFYILCRKKRKESSVFIQKYRMGVAPYVRSDATHANSDIFPGQ